MPTLSITDGAKGVKAAIAKAEELVAEAPDTRWMPSQFDNPANPEIHEKTTGPEIWEDTNGAIDVLISGVGTGGTLSLAFRAISKTPRAKRSPR